MILNRISGIFMATYALFIWAGATAAALAEPLQARIEHTEHLPAVSKQLKVGAEVSDSTVKPLTPANVWVRLPDWFCGQWSITEETRVYREEYGSGARDTSRYNFNARSLFSYGKQRDRQGSIWHYMGTPYSSETEMSGKIEHHQVLSKELAEVQDSKVVFKTRVEVFRVDSYSRRITETYQQESITAYTRVNDRELHMISSTKVFDASGKAQSLTSNEAYAHRVAGFQIVNYEDGKDLHSMFIEYLTAKGLTILAPD